MAALASSIAVLKTRTKVDQAATLCEHGAKATLGDCTSGMMSEYLWGAIPPHQASNRSY
jgi:hypothetical protein